MRLLSTKILSDSARENLNANGIELAELPFIKIDFLQRPDFVDFLKDNSSCPFVFTSRNGYNAFKQHATDAGLHSKGNAYSMKGATEDLLQRDGWAISGVAANSEELAKVILKANEPRLIYVSGNLRSSALPESLTESGIELHEWVLYETSFTPTELQENFDSIFFFSPSAVRSFFKLNKLAEQVKAFCIGRTTAATLAEYGHSRIFVPTEPSEAMMVDLVLKQLSN